MKADTERRSSAAQGGQHAQVLASAARALADIASHGRSAHDALAPFARSSERAAIHAVALGSVRWYLRLMPAAMRLLEPHPRPLAAQVQALLVVAIHQIEYSRTAPQSIVHAAVDAVRVLGQPRASGLVNAVLRRFIREREALLAALDSDLAIATAHPAWLVDMLRECWPEHATSVLSGNNAHPPLTVRLDLTRVGLNAYLEELSAAGLEGEVLSWAPAAVVLRRAVPVDAIPGFHDGRVAIQDAGAQLAAPILDPIPGMRVLDACAAPGGKTLHLLEYANLGELCAVDVDADRLRLVEANLARSHRHAHLACADVRNLTQQPWRAQLLPQGRLFDRILLDAPCSGTGVIRRHPDIKLLRRQSDIESSSKTQLEILREAFRLLMPGGRLLYCTCSVLPLENETVVQRFLEEERRAVPAPAVPAGRVPGAILQPCGVQLLPGAEAGTDGFYYACLEKTTAGN